MVIARYEGVEGAKRDKDTLLPTLSISEIIVIAPSAPSLFLDDTPSLDEDSDSPLTPSDGGWDAATMFLGGDDPGESELERVRT